jgi:hypothetical protein
MFGSIGTLVTLSLLITLKYRQYSVIVDLHTFQFTVAHTLEFPVFTSRLLATDLNTETSTSKYYKVPLTFLVQSLWNLKLNFPWLSPTENSLERNCT